jgi:hypothetical protein
MSGSISSWRGVSTITSWWPTPSISRNSGPAWRRSGAPSGTTAGNLLGTTRTDHPSPLASAIVSSSGGVCASLPRQRGQDGSRASGWRTSRTPGTDASWGRVARPGAAMTHSLVVGSCRMMDMTPSLFCCQRWHRRPPRAAPAPRQPAASSRVSHRLYGQTGVSAKCGDGARSGARPDWGPRDAWLQRGSSRRRSEGIHEGRVPAVFRCVRGRGTEAGEGAQEWRRTHPKAAHPGTRIARPAVPMRRPLLAHSQSLLACRAPRGRRMRAQSLPGASVPAAVARIYGGPGLARNLARAGFPPGGVS